MIALLSLPISCDEPRITRYASAEFQLDLLCHPNDFPLHLTGIEPERLVLSEEDCHETGDMWTGHGRPSLDIGGRAAADPGCDNALAGGIDGDAGAEI